MDSNLYSFKNQDNIMPKKTQGVDDFVSEVLKTIPKPYSEDVIKNVWLAIEEQSTWLEKYNELVYELGKDVVHHWIGRYTKKITGFKTLLKGVDAKPSKITGTYTKLDINNF